MVGPMFARVIAPVAIGLSLIAVGCNRNASADTAGPAASAARTNVYQAKGVIKAFGEGKKTVKIAHEDIPGYMKAMTMPFAVLQPSVLDGLKEADSVDFSFTEESDGRMLIQSIKKR